MPTFLPRSCWTLVMPGSAIMSKDGLSVRPNTTRTSAPLTAALMAVPGCGAEVDAAGNTRLERSESRS